MPAEPNPQERQEVPMKKEERSLEGTKTNYSGD